MSRKFRGFPCTPDTASSIVNVMLWCRPSVHPSKFANQTETPRNKTPQFPAGARLGADRPRGSDQRLRACGHRNPLTQRTFAAPKVPYAPRLIPASPRPRPREPLISPCRQGSSFSRGSRGRRHVPGGHSDRLPPLGDTHLRPLHVPLPCWRTFRGWLAPGRRVRPLRTGVPVASELGRSWGPRL